MSEEQPSSVAPSSKTGATAASPEEDGPVLINEPGLRISSLSLNVLTVLAVILVLNYAQSFLIPIVLGVLISYALEPLVSALRRLRIARAAGAAIAVTLLVTSLGVGVYTLTDQAMAIVSDVPAAAQRLRDRLRATKDAPGGALEKVQQAAREIDKAAQEAAAPTAAEQEVARRAQEKTGGQKVEIVDS